MSTFEEELNSQFAAEVPSAEEIELEKTSAYSVALERIQDLRQALEVQDPGMGNFLNLINAQLRKFPELAYMLSDEEIKTIVQGHCQKKFEYLEAKAKKPIRKSSPGKLADGSTLADLL